MPQASKPVEDVDNCAQRNLVLVVMVAAAGTGQLYLCQKYNGPVAAFPGVGVQYPPEPGNVVENGGVVVFTPTGLIFGPGKSVQDAPLLVLY